MLPAINPSILTADEIREIADYIDSIKSIDHIPSRLFDAVVMGIALSGLRGMVNHLEQYPKSPVKFHDIDYLACSDSKITGYVFMGMYLSRRADYRSSRVGEKKYHDFIVKNFNDIFPSFVFVKNEVALSGEDRDRLDILAKEKESGRPVIIELKLGNRSAHKQLRSYAFHFENPILINISESLPNAMREGILYRTYGGLGIEVTPDGQIAIAKLWGEK